MATALFFKNAYRPGCRSLLLFFSVGFQVSVQVESQFWFHCDEQLVNQSFPSL